MSARILVLSGTGAFADPWHEMDLTSETLATVLRGPCVTAAALHPDFESTMAPEVIVRKTEPNALSDLADFDLLVLNTSAQPLTDPSAAVAVELQSEREPLIEQIVAWAQAGGRVLAVHQTLLTAEQHPKLAAVIGGNWVTGVSGHPPIGELTLIAPKNLNMPFDGATQAGETLIRTHDEQYQQLYCEAGNHVIGYLSTLGGDESAGEQDPGIWVHQAQSGRAITSTLGHDELGYVSPRYRALLRNLVRWLLAE